MRVSSREFVLLMALVPTCASLALEPMGGPVGTAASVVAFMGTALGALLASFIDRAIDSTVTPQALGYLSYGALSVLAILWAGTAGEIGRSGRPSPAESRVGLSP